MDRRDFLKLSLAIAGIGSILASCKSKKEIKGRIVGTSAKFGHLLRDNKYSEPEEKYFKKVVIIGGGVSGLSAGYFLSQNNISDFEILELESEMGGNSLSGHNKISAYPWGAHYIPIPNNNLNEYLEFLKDCNVITSINESGLPVYNDYYLCFSPQERLYINGRWQEGLIPNFGVPENEKKQIADFLNQMHAFRMAFGSDGKEVFAIPVDDSSKDEKYTKLDKLNMKQWLLDNNYTSQYLHGYVNYCTRDDFGSTLKDTSAWAGIHYFASRKGKGTNADYSDVLTWPEGNGWLVKQLKKNIKSNLRNNCLVVKIKETGGGVQVNYFDTESNSLKGIIVEQCIICVPQFVAARLIGESERLRMVNENMHYTPWMVANMTVSDLEERSGASSSWDNVMFSGKSLGYVAATHQLIQQNIVRKNLTYYLPLTEGSPNEARLSAYNKSHADWTKIIIDDLKLIHPNIEDALEEVNIMLWGHAMAKPEPGLIHGLVRKNLSESINNRIHFAHTDLAGISIFEEAFYQGLNAAKKVKSNL